MSLAPALLPVVSTPAAPAPGPFILLVDDQEACLDRLRCLVELTGHRCAMARSGVDALRVCRDRRPLAVVTDLSMPGLDGDAMALGLRSLHPSVPIVLVTGHDLDAPDACPLRAPFAAILRKPVDPERLLGVLGELLRGLGVEGRPDAT